MENVLDDVCVSLRELVAMNSVSFLIFISGF